MAINEQKTDKDVKYNKKLRSNTVIELEISIPRKEFESVYKAEVKALASNVEIKGFRKGKVPTDVAEKHVASEAMGRAFEKLMPDYTLKAVQKENILPVAQISYEAVQDSKSEDVVFLALVPIIPKFKVADLKKIKAVKESAEVTDKDVDDQVKHFWVTYKDKSKNMDDAWVKAFASKVGLKSSTLEELKKEIRVEIKKAKEDVVKKKYVAELLTTAIKESKIEIPEALIQGEADERERSFMNSLKQMKTSLENFCKIRGVTVEMLREQWWKDSLEALENDVFLSALAKDRGLKIEEAELDGEIKKIRENNKSADAALFDNPEWRSYISRVLLKRKSYETFLKEVGVESLGEAK